MTAIPQPSPASAFVRWAFGRLRRLRVSRVRSIVIGEVCFVGGWSTMWATSLGIIPHVPTGVWLSVMILGPALANGARRIRLNRSRLKLLRPARAFRLRPSKTRTPMAT